MGVVEDANVALLLEANAESYDATLDAIDQDSDAAPDSSSECEGALQESADETLRAEDWGNKTDTGFVSDSSVDDTGEKESGIAPEKSNEEEQPTKPKKKKKKKKKRRRRKIKEPLTVEIQLPKK